MPQKIFLREKDEYKRKMDPIGDYFVQAAKFLSIKTGDSYDKCLTYVRDKFKSQQIDGIINPSIKYFERASNGDREVKISPLKDYIYTTAALNMIMVPSGTVYLHPSMKQSLITKFVDRNTKLRSLAKKEMFKAKAAGDTLKFVFKNNEQNNRKLGSNSVSGAFVATGSFLNNPSAHSSLTSTTRTGTSLANACNERLVAGNRHYYSPEVVINNIISTITETDYDALMDAMMCPALSSPLVYPSINDVMECISYSSDLYWRDHNAMRKIRDLVESLSPKERAAFVYTGDFYHIRKLNQKSVFAFIERMIKKVHGVVEDPLAVIKTIDEQCLITAHIVCSDEVKGFGKDYEKMAEAGNILGTLVPTALNIRDTVYDYRALIKGFFLSSNFPPSVSYIRDMIRRVVVISDTDSTCFATDEWIEAIRGDVIFDSTSLAIAGVVTYMATQTFMHVMAQYSANINVEKEKLHTLAYKSEWTWSIVTPMNVAKHYFARALVQEGNVFAEPELELKGVHLKNSNTPQRIVKDCTAMINEVMDVVTSNQKISLNHYLNRVGNMEKEIEDSLLTGKLEFYRQVKIKNAEAYSKGENESPYQHHNLWNEVFAPKYGQIDIPPYSVAKVATTLANPTKLKEWLDNIKDRELAERMGAWLVKQKKTSFNTFYISSNYLLSNGMIEELKPAIDTKRIVLDLANMYYIVLESLGFYKKVDKTLTELGY